jgi:hypothetical protein
MKSALTTTITMPAATLTMASVGMTIKLACVKYGWTRSFIYTRLAMGDLVGMKAGRRTPITTESADRLFASLPRATFRLPQPEVTGLSHTLNEFYLRRQRLILSFRALIALGVPTQDLIEEADGTGSQLRQIAIGLGVRI